MNETTRFSLQDKTFTALNSTLRKLFPFFSGTVHYLDDEGDFVVMTSEEDFQYALQLDQKLLRLALGDRNPAPLYLNRWLKKRDPSNAAVLQPVIISLINQGFNRHCIKRNFELLQANAGDTAKTAEALREKCRPDRKRKYNGRDDTVEDGQPSKMVRLSKEERRAVKQKRKEEKQAKKEEKKDEKSEWKCDSKDEEKEDKKERKREKKERKHHKHGDKHEKHEKRGKHRRHERAKTFEASSNGQTHDLSNEFKKLGLNSYPSNCDEKVRRKEFSQVFLDGNNMLFVTNALRHNTLSGKRAKAEQMLATAALTFGQLVGINTEIVYDSTSLPRVSTESVETVPLNSVTLPPVGQKGVFQSGNSFMVSSAHPQFATTDDKLISWARFNLSSAGSSSTSASPNPNCGVLVVTSDRALAGELGSLGITLMKPKTWFSLFCSLVNNHNNNSNINANDANVSSKNPSELVDGNEPENSRAFDAWCARHFPQ